MVVEGWRAPGVGCAGRLVLGVGRKSPTGSTSAALAFVVGWLAVGAAGPVLGLVLGVWP